VTRNSAVKEKILIVDDEEPIRKILRGFLEEQGYHVILASHGHEAIQLAETESPDLIILDVRMPKLDGIATCVKLRSQERTGTIPIIAATAFRDVVGEAADAGADDIVIKPFHLTELLRRVRAMLRVRDVKDGAARVAAYVRELKASLPPGE